MRGLIRWYFAIGLALAVAYTFQGGWQSANLLIRLPVGWLAIIGMVVAWPVMLLGGLIGWLMVTFGEPHE